MSAVLNSPSSSLLYITGYLKHSVNRNLYFWTGQQTHASHVCMCAVMKCLWSFPFAGTFIIINQHSLSPLFLLYSVHHVVSCLLMDSHWSSTCNSQLTDCCSTGVIQPTYCAGEFMKAFTLLLALVWGKIFIVCAQASVCVVLCLE